MDKFNAENERIKREYAEFLREADQKSEATVRGVEKAILRFEEYTGYCDFGRFNRDQAKGFRAALSSPADESKRLGNSTVLSTLKAVQRFFRWLSVQPGFKSKIDTNAIAYLNLSEKDIRAATSSPTKPSPTMDQLKRALGSMPSETILEKRDRAVFALLMMTGIRDNAAASLLLGHVDIDRQMIIQDPKSVRTKNSKLIESVLLPLGLEIEGVLFSWVGYLRDELRWQPDDEKRAKVGDALRGGISWRCSDAVNSQLRKGYATCQRLPSLNCPIHRDLAPTRLPTSCATGRAS